MIRTVVAGLDGSPESLAAADWAAREALRRGAQLRLVHAWEPQPDRHAVRTPSPGRAPAPRERPAERMLREAPVVLRRRYPGLSVTADQVAGEPAPVLLSAAADAELTVLGSRVRGVVSGFGADSVSLAVVGAATGPVVLVRTGDPARDERRPQDADGLSAASGYRDVVLGLDLERPSEALIGFAFDAASRCGAALRVVHGWNPPWLYGAAPAVVDPDVGAELAANESEALIEVLRPWREKFPDVRVDARVTMGAAAHQLCEASADASLMVLGLRTRHSAVGRHIGSVLHAVLHRSTAPVAVVPHD